MTINTSLFTTQSGDYSVITKAITADDALAFAAIYQALKAHAESSLNPNNLENFYTLQDYVNQGICLSLREYSLASIATLSAVGLIKTNDNLHLGLTLLGLGFYQFIQV